MGSNLAAVREHGVLGLRGAHRIGSGATVLAVIKTRFILKIFILDSDPERGVPTPHSIRRRRVVGRSSRVSSVSIRTKPVVLVVLRCTGSGFPSYRGSSVDESSWSPFPSGSPGSARLLVSVARQSRRGFAASRRARGFALRCFRGGGGDLGLSHVVHAGYWATEEDRPPKCYRHDDAGTNQPSTARLPSAHPTSPRPSTTTPPPPPAPRALSSPPPAASTRSSLHQSRAASCHPGWGESQGGETRPVADGCVGAGAAGPVSRQPVRPAARRQLPTSTFPA